MYMYMNFLNNKKDEQKRKRSAESSNIFVNEQTGQTYFIKQIGDCFRINGVEYQKKPIKITITKKVKKPDSIKTDLNKLSKYLNK
jgi:hypothetical protein